MRSIGQQKRGLGHQVKFFTRSWSKIINRKKFLEVKLENNEFDLNEFMMKIPKCEQLSAKDVNV